MFHTTGVTAILVVVVLSIPVLNLLETAKILRNIFCIFPIFSFGYSLFDLDVVSIRERACQSECEERMAPKCDRKLFCKNVKECCGE